MTDENQHLLEKLYQQYNDPIKPLLAEIEAVYEKFPLALYNEIRAMNDHVARAFTTEDDNKAKQQIEKAFNHVIYTINKKRKNLTRVYALLNQEQQKNISKWQSMEVCQIKQRSW